MLNATGSLLSKFTTRLGAAGLFSSLSPQPEGCRMLGRKVSAQVSVSASSNWTKAVELLEGKGVWRGRTGDYIELTFPGEVQVNTLILRERSSHSQRFSLKKPVRSGGAEHWETFYESDKIERYRFCAFPMETVSRVRFCLEQTEGEVALTELSLYLEPKQRRKAPFRVSGYLPLKPREILELDGEARRRLSGYLDTLNEVMLFSTWGWNKDGALYYSENKTPETAKEDKEVWLQSARAIRELCGQRAVKLIPTCWNPGGDTAASLQNHMDEVVERLSNVIVQEGFDGIDFDWEFPKGKREWELYSQFIIKMKEKLGPHGKILSVCFADWGVQLSAEAVRAIDTMSYMAYDIIDFSGYHSSFGRAAVRAVEYAQKLGFTRRQINLGIPFYGRPAYAGEFWPIWKDEAAGSYWQNYYPEVWINGMKMDSYYNSPGMCADKTAYAIQLGLGGVMLFSMSCDRPAGDPLCLTDAVGRTVRQRLEQPENLS